MIDALVYVFQVLVVFVTTVAATVGTLWFLSLPWRKLFTDWEPRDPSWVGLSEFTQWLLFLIALALVVIVSFDAVVF